MLQFDPAVRTRICSKRHRALEKKRVGSCLLLCNFSFMCFMNLHTGRQISAVCSLPELPNLQTCMPNFDISQVHRLRRQLQELQAHRFTQNFTISVKMNSEQVFSKTSEDDCRLAKVPVMLGGLPIQVQCRLHTHTHTEIWGQHLTDLTQQLCRR